MRSDRSRAQALAGLAVLSLHFALLWLLVDSSTTRATRDQRSVPAARIALRLIDAPPTAAAAPPAAVAPARGRAPKPKPIRSAAGPSRPGTAPPPPREAETTEPPRETAARPEPAAGADAPSLLDTEATRRAIRASARAASLGDQLARAREEPERAGAQARLANGVKSAGKGDCLKGDFAGSGMGLLSLPFLVIAGARGDCPK